MMTDASRPDATQTSNSRHNRRRACHAYSSARYEAEGRALGLHLAAGDLGAARECCRHVVAFLRASLSPVPSHPLLALQRYTLADLHAACDDTSAALEAMEECVAGLAVSYAEGAKLRKDGAARLAELRETQKGHHT